MPQFDYSQVPGAIPDQPEVGAGEFGKVLGAGAADVGSNLASAGRYFFEAGGQKDGADIMHGLQEIFGAGGDYARDAMNPETRKLLSSAMTSNEFWDRPLLATALKTTGMVPSVAALAIPGGLLADTVAASVAVAAGGGALSAGQGIDEFYKKLDAMPDKELRAQSAKYDALRDIMDERDARAKFAREAQGWAPAINAILGAGTALVGPAGTAARRFAGGTGNVIGAGERGALAAGAIGAGEGAATNALQSGVADVLSQQADVEANFAKDLDYARSANAALEGGALGGLLGGVAGTVLHGGKAPPPAAADRLAKELNTADAGEPVSTNDQPAAQVQSGRATTVPAKPATTVQVGNPQSAPAGSERTYPKAKGRGKGKSGAGDGTGVEVVKPDTPDTAQQAAIASAEPPSEAPDVVGALQRLTSETPPAAPAAPATPEVTPQRPVPQQVQQAVQNTQPPVRDNMSQPEPVREVAPQPHTLDAPEKAAPIQPQLHNMVTEPEGRPSPAPVAAPAGTPPRTGRVLRRLDDINETAPIGDVAANLGIKGVKVDENLEPIRTSEGETIPLKEKVSHKGKEADAAKADQIKRSQEIADKHQPTAAEDDYLKKIPARDEVVARAQRMVAEAKEAGVPIKKVLRRGKDIKAAGEEPGVQLLTLANELAQAKEKHKQGAKLTEAVARFRKAELEVRGGFSDEMLAVRRAEGDEKMAARKTGSQEGAADATPKPEYKEEAPQQEIADQAPVEKAPTVREAEDTITTGTSASKRPIQLDAGTEEVGGKTRARAASGDKLAGEEAAARKAALIAEMNAKFGRPPTKAKPAGEVVDVNPSEAQKAAGNYKKGHRRVEGLDFTIENPKGSIRRGRGPEGDWSVRMPADYGYIRRTTGADGDHIDAYDLRSGSRTFVLDQLDRRTGNFDEHKVFFRAKDEEHVKSTYNKAFSDGGGPERAGYLHEVTKPELMTWIDQADTTKPHLEHVLKTEEPPNTYTPPSEGERVVADHIRALGGEVVQANRSDYLANELDRFNFDKMPGVGGTLARFFLSRFKQLANKTDFVIHYFDDARWNKAFPNQKEASGMHWTDAKGNSHIAVKTSLDQQGLGHGGLAHVVLHETAHAVTVREIDANPAFRAKIEKLMKIASDWMEDPVRSHHVEAIYGAFNPEGDVTRYAFTNAREFVAEAFSNPGFQEILSQIPVNDHTLKAELGFGSRSMSMWDVFRGYVKKAIEKLTGRMPQFDSVLDSMMKVGEGLEKRFERNYADASPENRYLYTELGRGKHGPVEYVNGGADAFVKQAKEMVERLHRDHNTMENAPALLKLRTFDNIAQIADHYFGEKNPVRKIYNAVEKMRVTAENIFNKSEPLIRRVIKLRESNPEAFREFSSLLHDATVANVHPDVALADAKNAHLGKNKVVGSAVWSKAQHPELARRFSALPEEFKVAWHEVTKHFRDTQNAMSLSIIENRLLKLMGHEDAALARRIHEGTVTDADRALVGKDAMDVIEKAGELSKIEGPYVPLMRRGDHVVKGKIKLDLPTGAKLVDPERPNEFEFTDEKAAKAYAGKSDLKAEVKKVWVDETTGKMFETDPATGEEHKVSAKDLNAVPRYRVEVQNEHVEFVQGHRAAQRRSDELSSQGLAMDKVVPRRAEVGGRQGAELSASLQALVRRLEKSEAYKQSTPTQQAMLREAVQQAAAASHGSTRIASKALPRRGVAGYSEDLVKNLGDYGESSSRYLAKLEHMPEVEAGMKAMEERLKQDESKTNQYGRTAIRNEVLRRVNGDNGFEQGGTTFSQNVKRAMAISFIDKLASPAYSVINAMQPGMVTMPYLAGRHGVARAVTELGRAYNDLGSLGILKEGLKETARRIRGKADPDDFIANAKAGLKSADERAMIDHMVEHGVVDPNAGMEIRSLTKDYAGVGGKVDAAIGYLEGVTREMPRAVEAVNRLVTALASYRLERAKGASHEAAMQYAQDAVNNTQFNYSPTNSAPFMNHPLAKMAFQFKKYGQGMYQLIGGQIGRAYRNASPGDRAAAVKTLIALAGTHMAMAGALGLPTEPFKYLVMASGLVTGAQWGDVEDKVRKAAADVFGKTGGEVFSRGLPRLINLDLSRMGLDSVTSFGEPRGAKDADVKSWLFDTLGGPIASLAFDWGKGLNLISNGDYAKAAEKLVPIKAASDTLRAYRQATEGKRKSSGAETSAPYNFQEAVQRAAGFGSAREAEEGAANSAYYRASQAQKDKRQALVDAWTSAPSTGKASAMAAITKWNQSQPAEVKIMPKELTAKLKKMDKDAQTSVRGITANKRDRHLLESQDYYNVE